MVLVAIAQRGAHRNNKLLLQAEALQQIPTVQLLLLTLQQIWTELLKTKSQLPLHFSEAVVNLFLLPALCPQLVQ